MWNRSPGRASFQAGISSAAFKEQARQEFYPLAVLQERALQEL